MFDYAKYSIEIVLGARLALVDFGWLLIGPDLNVNTLVHEFVQKLEHKFNKINLKTSS